MLNIAKHPLSAREAQDTSLSNIRDLRKSWTKKGLFNLERPKGRIQGQEGPPATPYHRRVRVGVEAELKPKKGSP